MVLGAGITGARCAFSAAQNGLIIVVTEKAKTGLLTKEILVSLVLPIVKACRYENAKGKLTRERLKRCGNNCDRTSVRLFMDESPDYGLAYELACIWHAA